MRAALANSKLVKTFLLSLGAAMFAACTTVPVEAPPQRRPVPPGPVIEQPPIEDIEDEEEFEDPSIDIEAPSVVDSQGLVLPHMQGRDVKRLAVLLPFSSRSQQLRTEANAMFQAAELAVFEHQNADLILIPLDTQGTSEGAQSAAQAAIAQGADVILGPIIAGNVQAAANIARPAGTPLIAFSNNQRVAGGGTYLLSFPPEAEVDRVVQHAAGEGVTRFAFFGPDNAYGRRVRAAFEASVRAAGGQVTATETYVGDDISVMQDPAQRLAQRYRQSSVTNRAFDAVLLPEGGVSLRSLAPLLPFYGIDPDDVLFMGTSRWDDRSVAREPALSGGIFAAADKEAREPFLSAFERTYGSTDATLTSLAYDAVMFGAYVADGDPRERRYRLETPEGFYGADGYVSFGPDGRPYRGLAIYSIRGGDFRLVDPAPRGPLGAG